MNTIDKLMEYVYKENNFSFEHSYIELYMNRNTWDKLHNTITEEYNMFGIMDIHIPNTMQICINGVYMKVIYNNSELKDNLINISINRNKKFIFEL